MVRRRRPTIENPIERLDAEPYRSMFEHTRKLAKRALARYGKPTMSRAEIRRRVDECLGPISLAEWMIKDREVG